MCVQTLYLYIFHLGVNFFNVHFCDRNMTTTAAEGHREHSAEDTRSVSTCTCIILSLCCSISTLCNYKLLCDCACHDVISDPQLLRRGQSHLLLPPSINLQLHPPHPALHPLQDLHPPTLHTKCLHLASHHLAQLITTQSSLSVLQHTNPPSTTLVQ